MPPTLNKNKAVDPRSSRDRPEIDPRSTWWTPDRAQIENGPEPQIEPRTRDRTQDSRSNPGPQIEARTPARTQDPRVQELQIETRSIRSSPEAADRIQKPQIEPRSFRSSPGCLDRAQEAQIEPRSSRSSPGVPDRAEEPQI